MTLRDIPFVAGEIRGVAAGEADTLGLNQVIMPPLHKRRMNWVLTLLSCSCKIAAECTENKQPE